VPEAAEGCSADCCPGGCSHRSTPERVPDIESTRDDIIPTIEVLKSSHQIQREVDKRMRELELNASGTGKNLSKLKSGRYRGIEAPIVRQVAWPQEFVYAGPNRNTVKYDELTPVQFMAGFLSTIQSQQSKLDQNRMLSYGIQLFLDADEIPWNVARGVHAVVLQEIEKGRADWRDTEVIDKLRTQYVRRSVLHSTPKKQHTPTKGREKRKVICNHFNSGSCSHTADHTTETMYFRHICKHCFTADRKAYNHSEAECRRKHRNTAVDGNVPLTVEMLAGLPLFLSMTVTKACLIYAAILQLLHCVRIILIYILQKIKSNFS